MSLVNLDPNQLDARTQAAFAAPALTRRQFGKLALAGLAAIALPTLLTGCSGGASGGDSSKSVTIGSKSFTESDILAEVYALALEDVGFTVNLSFNISNSVVHTAIVNGDIDIYPGYTGTALLSVLKLPMESDPDKVYQTVKDEYKKQFNLEWLDMTKANDSQAVAIAARVSQQYGIKTISDLQKHATELRFASGPEFDEREDALPALIKAYGPFDWKSREVIDDSLKYQLLKEDKSDVTSAATTEGNLVDTDDFTLLEDDKHVWPPYNVAPIVRADVLEKYPEIADALNAVGQKLDTATLTQLNARVDLDGDDYETVAKDFFDSTK